METIRIMIEEGYDFNNRFIKILNGMALSCKKNHYKYRLIELDSLEDSSEVNPVLVIAASKSWARATSQLLLAKNYHPIIVGLKFDNINATFITQNHERDAYFLTKKLCVNRVLRCAFLGFNYHSFGDMLKLNGFKQAMLEVGNVFVDTDIFPSTPNHIDIVDRFISVKEDYDIVFCANDNYAFLLISELPSTDNLEIASFGDLYIKHFSSVPFSSVSPNYIDMGKIAVDTYVLLHSYSSISNSLIYVTSKYDFIPDRSLTEHTCSDSRPNPGSSPPSDKDIDLLNATIDKCDEIDLKIIGYIMDKYTYEQIAEATFFSITALRKRVKKIYSKLGISTKEEFRNLINKYKLCFNRDTRHYTE